MTSSDEKIRLTLRYETREPITRIKKKAIDLGITPSQLVWKAFRLFENKYASTSNN
jgi:hypothetical protein